MGALPTSAVLGIRWGLLSLGIGGAVLDDDLWVQGWGGFSVVGGPLQVQMRQVSVHTEQLFLTRVLIEAGGDEAVGFDH